MTQKDDVLKITSFWITQVQSAAMKRGSLVYEKFQDFLREIWFQSSLLALYLTFCYCCSTPWHSVTISYSIYCQLQSIMQFLLNTTDRCCVEAMVKFYLTNIWIKAPKRDIVQLGEGEKQNMCTHPHSSSFPSLNKFNNAMRFKKLK